MKTSTAPLLIELLTEELPPRALQRLGETFAQQIAQSLEARGLLDDPTELSYFASPRRLAVLLPAVRTQAPERTVEVKGPSVKVGLDAQGQPTQALLKWAERQGAAIDSLTQGSDGKQTVFFWRSTVRGERLDTAIQSILEQVLPRLPVPKMMSYQLADGKTTVSFARPVQGLMVLHADTILPARLLGLESGRMTKGHRFQARTDIAIDHANSYAAQLEQDGRVLASFSARREQIRAQLIEQASTLGARFSNRASTDSVVQINKPNQFIDAGAHVPVAGPDDALLDEVTALVEWPRVYLGRFDPAFLAVPQECLILTMRTNQKYFPLFTPEGRLRSEFLLVSNMDIADPTAIIDGNERVIRPRLDDARFFFEQDLRKTLASREQGLAQVVYHAKLGTQHARSQRVQRIAAEIVTLLQEANIGPVGHASSTRSADEGSPDADLGELVARAAVLAKCDLLSGMVGEFPELQGTMGRYYALHDGEPPAVAQAIEEHYRPRFAGDGLPRNAVGRILALADKLETLAGIWGIGLQPTGDKDPFALRRQALGVVRILIEHELPLSLNVLLAKAFTAFADIPGVTPDVDGLQGFVLERLRGSLRERWDLAAIEAVLAVQSNRLDQLTARLRALAVFRQLPEAVALATANKRIGNILRKSAPQWLETGVPALVSARLVEPAERALADALEAISAAVDNDFTVGRYAESLTALAALRTPVDAFFEAVMVMAEDPALRNNRLALLASLHARMNRVADLSRLAV
jgi:glycyl-tRNA synthetase beta chain